MPRGRAVNGSGTIITHKGRKKPYQVQFTVNGERKSGGYYLTYQEASAALRSLTASVDRNEYIEPQKMKVSEYLKIWLEDYNLHIKPGTLVQYRGYVKNHINPAIGDIPLFKLQPHHIQAMVNGLTNHGKKKDKPISYKTRKNVHGCISAALDTAVRIKYVKDNAATGCTIPKDYDNIDENESEVNPFSTDELSAFLNGIKGSRFEDIYNFALDTGCRLSETLGLRWSRCNLKDSRITIDCQLLIKREKGSSRKLAPTKNTKTRSFKVGKSVVFLLQSVKVKQAKSVEKFT